MTNTDKAKRLKVADWKQLVVRVPPDVHRAFKVRAAEEGKSGAEIVERLIRQYLVGKRNAEKNHLLDRHKKWGLDAVACDNVGQAEAALSDTAKGKKP